MKQLHALWLLVTTGVSSLLEVGNMIIDGTKVKFRSAPGPAGVRTVLDDSDIVSTLGGNQTDKVPSAAAVKSAVDASTLTVNPNSSSFVAINNGQLEVKPLLVTRPIIDQVSTSLADALAARTPIYNAANVADGSADLQAGDTLILPLHVDGLSSYLHNGGTAGDVTDFTVVEKGSITEGAIRALLTGANGIDYDIFSGVFKLGGEITESTDITLNPAAGDIAFRDAGNDVLFRLRNTANKSVTLEYKVAGLVMADDIILWKSPNGNASQFLFQDRRNQANKRGIEVDFTNYSGLVPNSLTPKGYVDSLISTNGVSKANPTVNTTAGVWTTVPHNFALTVGNFDCLTVTMFDSTGLGVTAPFRVKNANEIEVLTGEAINGLKVRMLKTL